MVKITKIVLISFLLIFVAGIQSAHAAQLKVSDGVNPDIIIVDNDGLYDTNDAVGFISYTNDHFADLGSLSVSASYIYGTNLLPGMHLHVDFTTIYSTGGSTVVSFSEIGFGPLASSWIRAVGGGINAGTSEYNAYVDDNTNEYFNQYNEIIDQGPYNPGEFDFGNTIVESVGNPFSMTIVTSVNHTGTGVSGSDFDVAAIVPEPVSSLLFLAGGTALGLRRFRRKG